MRYIKQCFNLVNKRNIFPEYVTFFVTSNCNAACRHCFYWQNLNSNEKDLTCEEIDRISSNMDYFLFLLITGGEPFLRDDIPEIVKIFYGRNRLKKLAVATNGYFVESIEKGLVDILKECPELQLNINISIDGVNADHDLIRGKRGMFDRAVATIKIIKQLQRYYPDLLISVIYTFSSLNQEKAVSDYEYIKETIKPDYFNLSLVRGDTPEPGIKAVDLKAYNNLWKEVKKDIFAAGFKRTALSNLLSVAKVVAKDLAVKTSLEDRYITPCYAGKTNIVIYSNGDVFPCELLKERFGNLRQENYDFKRILFSATSERIKEEIQKKRCYCYHGCNALANVLYNLRYLPKIAIYYLRQYL